MKRPQDEVEDVEGGTEPTDSCYASNLSPPKL